MRVTVYVVPDPAARTPPPDGAPVTIEIRDVSEADGPSVTVVEAATVIGAVEPATDTGPADVPGAVAVAELAFDDDLVRHGRDLAVWVRVNASGQSRLAAGDWITTQSYPIRAGHEAIDVEVRPI